MIIEVINGFGTKVGDAVVVFLPVGAPETLALELQNVFEPEVIVPLPTKNPAIPWRLKVRQ